MTRIQHHLGMLPKRTTHILNRRIFWWYANYGYGYAAYDSPAAYDGRYWQDLAIKVQLELARRGYYHGQINGVIDSSSSQAIRAFQKARGLPVTGLIDPGVLRSLKLPVP